MLTKTNWFIGQVENREDPDKRGRVQVRIIGIHTPNKTKNEVTGNGIPEEDLPWAMTVMPLTFGGVPKSTVPVPQVLPGAWVLGISLDGDVYNDLFILGVIQLKQSVDYHSLGTSSTNAVGAQNMGVNPQDKVIDDTVIDTEDESNQAFIKAFTAMSSEQMSTLMNNFKDLFLVDGYSFALENIQEEYNNNESGNAILLTNAENIDKHLSDPTIKNIVAQNIYDAAYVAYGTDLAASLALVIGPAQVTKLGNKYGEVPGFGDIPGSGGRISDAQWLTILNDEGYSSAAEYLARIDTSGN